MTILQLNILSLARAEGGMMTILSAPVHGIKIAGHTLATVHQLGTLVPVGHGRDRERLEVVVIGTDDG